MRTYVALLRGINVGGRNSLPMKELAAILSVLGCLDIKTYIQSGNIIFRSDDSPKAIAQAAATEIGKRRGFEPHILVLDKAQFKKAIADNPFSSYTGDPKSLHFGFLDAKPAHPDLDTLQALKTPTEQFALIARVFYLLAPNGVGRSKLAAKSEKLIGCAMTDRNWNTVANLNSMLDASCS